MKKVLALYLLIQASFAAHAIGGQTDVITSQIEQATKIDVEVAQKKDVIKLKVPKKEKKVIVKKEDPYKNVYIYLSLKKQDAIYTVYKTKEKGEKEKTNVVSLKEKSQKVENTKETVEKLYEKGYCYLEKDIKLSSNSYFRVPCILKGDKDLEGYLFGVAKVDVANLKVEFIPSRFETVDGHIYKAVGQVFRDDKMTDNLADEVNSQVMKEALANAFSSFAKSTAEGYKDYALNSGTQVSVNGDTVIETHTVDKNYPLLYGAFMGVSSFVDTISSYLKSKYSKLPYVFKVNKKKLYVEVVLEKIR